MHIATKGFKTHTPHHTNKFAHLEQSEHVLLMRGHYRRFRNLPVTILRLIFVVIIVALRTTAAACLSSS